MRRRRVNRFRKIESKAPLISVISSEATFPSPYARSISWIRHVTRSVAALFGRAPNCWGFRTLWLIAVYVSRREISLSSPFPK